MTLIWSVVPFCFSFIPERRTIFVLGEASLDLLKNSVTNEITESIFAIFSKTIEKIPLTIAIEFAMSFFEVTEITGQ